MEVYEDDIWVVSFPKCGTTWTQEMVWTLHNNLDFESKVTIDDRYAFIELHGIQTLFDGDELEKCNKMARPRYIKSHLPLFLLPDKLWTIKPKIIYVTRNPKDAAVSYFYHHRYFGQCKASNEEFMEAFLKNQMIYTPYIDHVFDFWMRRDEPNILFLHYEDMKSNLQAIIEKTMKFLNRNYSQEQIDKLCNFLSLESMRANPRCNYEHETKNNSNGNDENSFKFIRKGQVGSYKYEMSDEINKSFDDYIKNSSLFKAGFPFKGLDIRSR